MDIKIEKFKIIKYSLLVVFLTFFLGGCSTPKKLDESINKAEKSHLVEQVKNKLVLFSANKQADLSGEIFKTKLNSNWHSYNNVEPKYSFKYPLNVSVNKEDDQAEFLLKVDNLKIEKTNASGTTINEDLLVIAKNIQNGENDAFWGESLEDSRIISKVNGVNYREELLFTGLSDCDLNFERKLVFYDDDYLVTISLIAPAQKIVAENPDFFKLGPEECQNKQIWKFERQSEFYLMLKENQENKTAQAWFNLFDLIKESLKIGNDEVLMRVLDSRFLENNKNLNFPELRVSAEKVNNDLHALGEEKTKASEADYYVTFEKNNFLSISFYSASVTKERSLSSRNYNLKTDQVLRARDIFKEAKINDLFILVSTKYQENIKNYQLSEYKDRVFSLEDLDNFNITNDGIRFNYGGPVETDKFTPKLFAFFSFKDLEEYLKLEIKK